MIPQKSKVSIVDEKLQDMRSERKSLSIPSSLNSHNLLPCIVFSRTIMRVFLLLILVFTGTSAFSQGDSVFLFSDHLIFGGKKTNMVVNGSKTGVWIDYVLTSSASAPVILKDSAQQCYHKIQKEYRLLKEGEVDGFMILLPQHTDTMIDGTSCFKVFKRITNRLAADEYRVTARGNYLNNLKDGYWEYFHANGQLAKRIHYAKGLPDASFQVLRDDGTLSLDVQRVGENEWEICKYSDMLRKIGCKRQKVDEFKALY